MRGSHERRGVRVSGTQAPMPGMVWVDGALLAATDRHLSVFDRGFQLGDGVFETMRARGGRVTELAEHLARLHRSAEGLEIALAGDVDATLTGGIAKLLAAESLDGPEGDASIRITVSRGVFRSRGVLPPDEDVAATLVIQAWPVVAAGTAALDGGVHLVTSRIRRDPQDPMAALKTTSRAGYVYAKLEARRAGADDALFLTIDDHLSEATSANLFLVRRAADDGVVELATPSLDCAILAGTTRSWLLGWAAGAGLSPLEGHLTLADLESADEVFLCSSVAGVVSVARIDDRTFGDGRPGRWTTRARDDREAMIRASEAAQ